MTSLPKKVIKSVLRPVEDALIDLRMRRALAATGERGVYPRQLAIETINRCNAACSMCPYPTLQRHKGTMSLEDHRVIVDKVAAWGAPIDIISHAGMGEPLIDKTIAEKIAYEKSVFPQAKVAVYSNASALDAKRLDQLHEARLDILSVSLNAARKATYETVMQLPFERTQENLQRFLDRNRTSGHRIQLNVSLIPTEHHTPEEIEEFVAQWKGKADNVIVPPWITWGNYFAPKGKKRQYSCRYLWEVLQIDWDGTVAMCCEDYETKFPLGNILNQDPQEIWNSKMFQEQRRRQVEGDFAVPSICQNCVESHDEARAFWRRAKVVPGPGAAG